MPDDSAGSKRLAELRFDFRNASGKRRIEQASSASAEASVTTANTSSSSPECWP